MGGLICTQSLVERERALVEEKGGGLGVKAVVSEVWAKGGEGGRTLAAEVVRLCEQPGQFQFTYAVDASIEEKLDAICKKVYHAEGVTCLLYTSGKARRRNVQTAGSR